MKSIIRDFLIVDRLQLLILPGFNTRDLTKINN